MTIHKVNYDAAIEKALKDGRVNLSWRQSERDLGEFVSFQNDLRIEPYSGIFAGSSLCSIGAFSYTHSPVQPGMRIGRYCAISWGLTVTGPRHPYEWLTVSNFTYDRNASTVRSYMEDSGVDLQFRDARVFDKPMPIVGNDVWIGQNVTLNRGVRLGHGCVVAAYSTVTKDVPPYAIVGGNPAQFIKFRFPPRIREDLLDAQWWLYSPSDILGEDITRVESFLEQFADMRDELTEFSPKALAASDLLKDA